MITPAYAPYMAAFNAEMDRRFIDSALRLSDAQRREDIGLFWKSLFGTFNHILWVDHVWLNRLTGSPLPPGIRDYSDSYFDNFDAFIVARQDANRRLSDWAGTVTQEFLDSDFVWYRGKPDEFTTSSAMFVAHIFTHQVHHRGQIHAALTHFDEDPGDTSIWVMGKPPFGLPTR